MDKLKLILTRDNEHTSTNVKDVLEIEKENGGFVIYSIKMKLSVGKLMQLCRLVGKLPQKRLNN